MVHPEPEKLSVILFKARKKIEFDRDLQQTIRNMKIQPKTGLRSALTKKVNFFAQVNIIVIKEIDPFDERFSFFFSFVKVSQIKRFQCLLINHGNNNGIICPVNVLFTSKNSTVKTIQKNAQFNQNENKRKVKRNRQSENEV